MMRRFHPGLSAIKSEFIETESVSVRFQSRVSLRMSCNVPLVGLVFGGIANWCSSGVGYGLIQGIKIGIALVNLKITQKNSFTNCPFPNPVSDCFRRHRKCPGTPN